MIQLPIFPVPVCFDGRPCHRGIKPISIDVFELAEQAQDIAAQHGFDRVVAPEYRPMFAQFDGADYVVAVGRVKAVYPDWIHARREEGLNLTPPLRN